MQGIKEEDPLFGDAVPLYVEVMQEGQLWFTEPHSLVVGQLLHQSTPIAELNKLFDMFGAEWRKRWGRHRDIPDSHWSTLIDFAKAALHPHPMPSTEIDEQRWLQAVKSKPQKAATGMDGVARLDLLRLHHEHNQQMLSVIQTTEQTGQWPQQMCHGAVHSLRKTENASSVDAFRPITVLPVPYRTWASIRGRELLKHLGQLVPGTLCGNVAHRSAGDMWYSIQLSVEQALVDDRSLVGGIMDICKAFSCLPRCPLLAIAKHLGVASNILVPWKGMLDHLQRHFVVRQAYGPGISAVTGFAEGCCLSVSAMLLVNLTMHAYMSLAEPSIHTWSYVDNWEFTGVDALTLQSAMDRMEKFASLMDIQLDKKKSMVWAITASDRQNLREGSVQVVRNVRDLGGHLQFTRQLTNSTLVAKCDALGHMWAKLMKSFAPRKIKHRVIRCKAWPSALHACPGVHVADAILRELRAAAMRSVGLSKPGSNSMLYLSLVLHPCHDPEGYILIQCIRPLRRTTTCEIVGAYLSSIVQIPHRKRVPGPIGVLTMRLELLGWMWQSECLWIDQFGLAIDLFASPSKSFSHVSCSRFNSELDKEFAIVKDSKECKMWMRRPHHKSCENMRTLTMVWSGHFKWEPSSLKTRLANLTNFNPRNGRANFVETLIAYNTGIGSVILPNPPEHR